MSDSRWKDKRRGFLPLWRGLGGGLQAEIDPILKTKDLKISSNKESLIRENFCRLASGREIRSSFSRNYDFQYREMYFPKP